MSTSLVQILNTFQNKFNSIENAWRRSHEYQSCADSFFKKCLAEGGIPFEVKTNCNFYSSESGMAAFLALRKQAENNGLTGMSLDEINAEISAARAENGKNGA